MLYPDVRHTPSEVITFLYHILYWQMCHLFFKPRQAFVRDLLIEEYAGTGEDDVKNRKAFSQIIGDVLFNVPAVKAAKSHRGILSYTMFKCKYIIENEYL